MTLDAYLKKHGEADAAFGARCKPRLHRTEVWKIKKGHRKPRSDKVAAIEAATDFQVKARDLIG